MSTAARNTLITVVVFLMLYVGSIHMDLAKEIATTIAIGVILFYDFVKFIIYERRYRTLKAALMYFTLDIIVALISLAIVGTAYYVSSTSTNAVTSGISSTLFIATITYSVHAFV